MTRKPIVIAETVRIDRQAPEVWEAISNYEYDFEWREGLTEMTPTPPGPAAMGTKVREVVRSGGRDYVVDAAVTEFEPGASYRFEGAGTLGVVCGGREVRPVTGGAEFTYLVEITPEGGMRLLRPLLGRIVGSGLRKNLANLKRLLEARE